MKATTLDDLIFIADPISVHADMVADSPDKGYRFFILKGNASFIHSIESGEDVSEYTISTLNAKNYYEAASRIDKTAIKPRINLALLSLYMGNTNAADDSILLGLSFNPNEPRLQLFHQCIPVGIRNISDIEKFINIFPEFEIEIKAVISMLKNILSENTPDTEISRLENASWKSFVLTRLTREENESLWAMIRSDNQDIV
jgi:hypothetical protein